MAVISLSRVLAHWCESQPDALAIAHEEASITFAELEASTNRLARAYQELGVGKDDFVMVGLANGIEFFEACFAAWKLGATPLPVSAKLPVYERLAIIEVGKPALLVGITDTDSTQSKVGELASNKPIKAVPANFSPGRALSANALPELTATSYKVMTSGGSTGRPKLIVSARPACCDMDAELLNFKERGAILIPGPLYHNGPFLWAMESLFKGSRVVVTTRFDAQQTLMRIEEHKVDTVYMVPTMMQRIWNLPKEERLKYDLSSLKALWHLAAPCPTWLKEAYIDWLGAACIWELYGGTEGQGSTVISGEEWLKHVGSVGKPVLGCAMKVVGENGETLAAGETGEIFMRPDLGAGTTYRYIGAEAKSIEGGWESLGDIGRMDEDGYLYLSDRLADMILSGAANIYPAEVEAAIDAMQGVRSSVVIGLPHTDLGNAVHAIVDVPDKNITEAALLEHLSERLVRYKLPRSVEFVSEPLRDDAGKVRRKQLKEARL